MYFTVSDNKYRVRLHGATFNCETGMWTFNVTDGFLASRKGRGLILYDIETDDSPPVLIYREIEGVSFWEIIGRKLKGVLRW